MSCSVNLRYKVPRLNLSQTKISWNSWFGKYRWLDCFQGTVYSILVVCGGFRWHHQEATKNADASSVPLGHGKWWIGIFYITKSAKHTRNNWAVLGTVSDLLHATKDAHQACKSADAIFSTDKSLRYVRYCGYPDWWWLTPRWIVNFARHSWSNGNTDT